MPPDSTTARVWIIDDTAFDREHTARALRARFDVETFDHATVAIERLAQADARPDVIVVDWVMPNIDGEAFCRFVRSHVACQSIALLVITADNERNTVLSALACGADDFVRKPYDAAELIARVTTLARSRQSERAREGTLRELAQLQKLTAKLATSVRTEDIAAVALEHFCEELGAEGGSVSIVRDGQLEILQARGFDPELIRRFTTMSLSDRLPVTDAVRENRSIWIDSPEALRRSYPSVAALLEEPRRYARWAAIPLRGASLPVGVLGFALPDGAGFTTAERAAFERLAAITGAAFDRARLYDQERSARERALATAQFGEELVAIVSHDLRNPLAAVSILLDAASLAPDLAFTQEVAVRAQRPVTRMRLMIDQLLDLTRVRLGAGIVVSRRPASIAVIAADVARETQTARPGLEVSVAVTGDATGEWDPERLEQLLTNVVTNAAQHGTPGAPVRIVVTGDVDCVSIAVHNKGTPIPPDTLTRVFEPFQREYTHDREGLGLGLYIAREIAHRHGGTIALTSTEAGETTVELVLPRA